ncbi:hypothetical protein G7K_1501-t1 [Saitoella complicata NRRL Y-17804]|uniref:Uncharacterized protein n=1 Tax=Saitoella complicata (strain BCRC 22490 / CBS 7301 / JCM 7358 / NBRC 10748 / NRRL Y-17804) TaxID=698492 RepID=A0A0E9NBP0_SAICN|nr:hypothetical protein G7K_1501-t1 [Saitoella complicata NRRL Y-17804]
MESENSLEQEKEVTEKKYLFLRCNMRTDMSKSEEGKKANKRKQNQSVDITPSTDLPKRTPNNLYHITILCTTTYILSIATEMCCLHPHSETRSMNNNSHQTSRNSTSNGQSNDPSTKNPNQQLPVNHLQITIRHPNSHGSTSNRVRSRDGDVQTGGQHDCQSRTELHGETTGGGVRGETVSEVTHDVVTVGRETDNDGGTTERENPDGDIGLGARNNTTLPNLVDNDKGTDSVGDIISTVSERRGTSRQNLQERVEVLSLVIILRSTSVHLSDANGTLVTSVLGTSLLVDDVHLHTTESELGKTVAQEDPDVGRQNPGTADLVLLEVFEGGSTGGGGGGGGVDVVVGGRRSDLIGGGGGLGLAELHVTGSLSLEVVGEVVGFTLVVLADETTVEVILDRNSVGGSGEGKTLGLPEVRAEEEVVPADSRVLANETTVEVRNEEEDTDSGNDTSNTEDGTDDSSRTQLVKVETGGTLPDDHHGQDTRSETKVDRDSDETSPEGILTLEDKVLGEHEDGQGESTGDEWSDDPGGDDTGDTVVAPLDTLSTVGGDTNTNNGTDDGVSSRDRETETSGQQNPRRGTNEGTPHRQHENRRRFREHVDVDNTILDGISNTGTQQQRTQELTNSSQETCLHERQGARGDGGSEGVCDIVCTDTVGVEESEDQPEGEDIVELRKSLHCCSVVLELSFAVLLILSRRKRGQTI